MQFAALPIRKSRAGESELLLITSRDTGRWVIPRGWPIPGKSGADTATVEAYEEAGITGYTRKQSVGRYRYNKRVRGGLIPREVIVFPMRVDTQLEDWPERQQRRTSWFACVVAARLVHETGLAAIMRTSSILVSIATMLRESRKGRHDACAVDIGGQDLPIRRHTA
ncbi:MAG: NUDIX hydrolase [Sphingomonadaceae bacterium]